MSQEVVDKDVVFVIGMIHDLQQQGKISSDYYFCFKITPRGLAQYDQIKASGYSPSPEKIREVLEKLTNPDTLNDDEDDNSTT